MDGEQISLDSVLLTYGYQLGHTMGTGAYGVVREAMQVPESIPLAVKIVDRSSTSKDYLDKFLPREIHIMMKIHHPNIIGLHKMILVGDFMCIFMERADGGDLLSLIMNHAQLNEDVARCIFTQILNAIHYCQQNFIAHRDLKCDNILLDNNGNVKLGDFGFSRLCIDEVTNQQMLSETYCGSAAYAAPEVVQGVAYDPLVSDIWSLGIILYTMICGSLPFDASNQTNLVQAQVTKAYTYPNTVKDQLSVELQDLISRLLEPDISKRITVGQIMAHPWLCVPDQAGAS